MGTSCGLSMSIAPHNGLNPGRRLDAAIVVCAVVLSVTLVLFAATPVRAATTNVAISDTTQTLFTPQIVTINVGDTVVWTCNDGAHTTTSSMGQLETWDSGTLGEGATYSHTFANTGNFSYVSTASGDTGDTGYVVVRQPTPEFPGYILYVTLAAAVMLAFLVERRLRA
jgi:plastocyanin